VGSVLAISVYCPVYIKHATSPVFSKDWMVLFSIWLLCLTMTSLSNTQLPSPVSLFRGLLKRPRKKCVVLRNKSRPAGGLTFELLVPAATEGGNVVHCQGGRTITGTSPPRGSMATGQLGNLRPDRWCPPAPCSRPAPEAGERTQPFMLGPPNGKSS
jgi:hypothetical protein